MKKLILVSVFTLVGLTAFGQESETAMAATEIMEVAQDGFEAIEIDKLPETVTAALTKSYPTAKIDKASVNDKMQYKLEVSLEDGTTGTLYADEDGNWIEL
ncbi:MAG: hypothetical protein NWQ38_01460 [Cellulophaga sp.]|nr:hypothetical protein [Cellulophaga sp.]